MLKLFYKHINFGQAKLIISCLTTYGNKTIITSPILRHILTVIRIIFKLIITFSPYMLILAVWQIIVILLNTPTYIMPTPWAIFKYIVNYKKILFENSAVTALEALLGLILAGLVSILLGIIALYSLFFVKAIYKILLLIQIIPLMAIAPLIIIWFGFGIQTKILVVFTICLFPALVSFLRGSMSIDKEYFTLFQSMGAGRWQIFKLVIFPSSVISLFSGLKIAVTYSVTGAVIAEYLGAEKGLGVYLARSISSFDTIALFANIFCIIVITLLFYKALVILEAMIAISPIIKKTGV